MKRVLLLLAICACAKKTPQAERGGVDLLPLVGAAEVEAVTLDLGTAAFAPAIGSGWSSNLTGYGMTYLESGPGPAELPFELPWSGTTEVDARYLGLKRNVPQPPVTTLSISGSAIGQVIPVMENVASFHATFNAPSTGSLRLQTANPNTRHWVGWDRFAFRPAGTNRPRVEADRLVLPAGTGLVFFVRLAAGTLTWDGDAGGALEVEVRRALTADVIQKTTVAAGATSLVLDGAGGQLCQLILRARGQAALLTRPRLTTGPPGVRPNVILYVVDTWRKDHLGLYGYRRPTSPNLEAFAGDALVFDNAFAHSAWTRPTVASILTGLETLEHGLNGTPSFLPPSTTSLATYLRRAGYRTAGFVTNTVIGPAFGFATGFDKYAYFRPNKSSLTVHVPATDVQRAALAWLGEAARSPEPFFAYVHAMDAHAPYTSGLRKEFLGNVPPELGSVASLDQMQQEFSSHPEVALKVVSAYDAEIAGWDAAFGGFVRGLRGLGLYDNTLLIVTADHGEHLLERGFIGHRQSLYPQETRIPLLVKAPRARGLAPARVVSTAQQIDILPTVLDEIGGSAPSYRGRSLLQLDAERPVFAYMPRDGVLHFSVTLRPWMLFRSTTTTLCRIDADPGCFSDVADAHPEQVARLQQLLDDHLRELGPAPVQTTPLPPDEARQLRDLGYVDN